MCMLLHSFAGWASLLASLACSCFFFQAPVRLILPAGICHGHKSAPSGELGLPLVPAPTLPPHIQELQAAASSMRVLVYADGVMLIFNCSTCHAIEQLHRCLPVFSHFAYYTGLTINFAKSYLIPKGEWTPEHRQSLACTGMQVNDSAKYLGVKFGGVIPKKAFAPAIQKAMLRALEMQHWDITLLERLALSEQWVLPLLSLPARVVFPDTAVIASLHSVYHTALRTTHYGITLPILSQDKDSGGGFPTYPKKISALATCVHVCEIYTRRHNAPCDTHKPLPRMCSPWYSPRGVPVGPSNLPTLQLGRIPYTTMPPLAPGGQPGRVLVCDPHSPPPPPGFER